MRFGELVYCLLIGSDAKRDVIDFVVFVFSARDAPVDWTGASNRCVLLIGAEGHAHKQQCSAVVFGAEQLRLRLELALEGLLYVVCVVFGVGVWLDALVEKDLVYVVDLPQLQGGLEVLLLHSEPGMLGHEIILLIPASAVLLPLVA